MSKKRLLEESTIRSFMKLANLQPLSTRFLKESDESDESGEEGEKDEDSVEESYDLEEGESLDEVVAEEGEMKEEGMETEGRPSPKKAESAGKGLTGKATLGISGAKTVKSPGKLKPLAQTSKHSTTSGNIKPSQEVGPKANFSKKNNATVAMVTENLEEMEMEDEPGMAMGDEMGAETPSDMAGEEPEHQDKVKDVIRSILSQLQTLAGEYGIDMEVADDGDSQDSGEEGEELPGEGEEAGEAAEMESPEEEQSEEDKEGLQESLNVLTRRVAARLLKESAKKKR